MNKPSRIFTLSALLCASLVACTAAAPGPANSAANEKSAAAPTARAKAVLVVVTNTGKSPTSDRPTGYWVAEVAQPAKVFADAGLRVDFASPKGGPAPVDPGSDPRNLKGTLPLSIEE